MHTHTSMSAWWEQGRKGGVYIERVMYFFCLSAVREERLKERREEKDIFGRVFLSCLCLYVCVSVSVWSKRRNQEEKEAWRKGKRNTWKQYESWNEYSNRKHTHTHTHKASSVLAFWWWCLVFFYMHTHTHTHFQIIGMYFRCMRMRERERKRETKKKRKEATTCGPFGPRLDCLLYYHCHHFFFFCWHTLLFFFSES